MKLGEIDTEKLIQAIKVRPGLYNKNDNTYYSHKKYKVKMWNEVCSEVFPNWNQLRPQDKVEYEHELQKRWKNLRTCFTRELAAQRKEKLRRESHGGPIKRRKRYEHFHLLTFLCSDSDQIDIVQEGNESYDDSSDPLNSEVKSELDYQETSRNVPANHRNVILEECEESNEAAQQINYSRNDSVEDRILDMLRDIKKDEEDEDRQFMLSLVPSFRKLTDKQKFEARIGILKVLKHISFDEE